ncbi:MAG TPA: carboxypeptidase regulatory-like domain-containing protein, partial [Candidatus Ozemobacteraceae bacterium]|nr:carboxypeptidase regulatory-like domain-containing protein [Candidatus Ozemobacteraceae bacterium]
LGALPLMVAGCLGSGGFNPVADSSLSEQANAALTAQEEQLASTQVLAARARPLALGKSRYSYAEPSFVVSHKVRSSSKGGPGCLKMRVLSASSADNIFITLDSMKVKPKVGKPISYDVVSKEIDLSNPSVITNILAETPLPAGVYNYMEFRIKGGRVVVGGASYPLVIPSNRVRFFGSFEIKDGYTTEISIRFFNKLSLKVKGNGKKKSTEYMLLPIVKISSTLVQKVVVAADGDVSGTVFDYVKKTPLSGVSVSLSGTAFSAVSDANGTFAFSKVPNGTYDVKLTHPEYLDRNSTVIVKGGEVSELVAEMNPVVIRSTVANTGWFSEFFPWSEANGAYAEMALEIPVAIDFVSLAFTRAEMVFDAEYRFNGGARMQAYMSSAQQVQVIKNLGGWWVGNNALLGFHLGEFGATNPMTRYTIDVTDYVRNNPSASYFFAARNEDALDIRMQNVQLSIFYR